MERAVAVTYNAAMFKDVFEYEFTYIKGFMRNVKRFADRPALTCPLREKTWTYAELNEECNKLARALLEDGVEKNEVVMYQLFNSPEFVFVYLASQKIGSVNCPVNFKLAPGETAYIIDDSKPAVFFYDEELVENALSALKMAKHKPRRVVAVGNALNERLQEGIVTYEQYVSGFNGDEPFAVRPVHIYDETTRLYTSGTTGLPKGVPLNTINEVLSAHDVIMHFPLSPQDKTMNMSPWFHRGGLHSGGPTPTLYVGGEVIILRQFHPRTCLDFAEKYGVTFLIGAPPMLKLLSDLQERKPRDLSKLKGIVTMGAPLEREACLRYHRVLTENIFNGYGTTETFWNTMLRPYDLPEMAGSAGRSCTDDEVLVVKKYADRRAEPDELAARDGAEIGEVIIKTPAKSTYSYYNSPAESEKAFYKGWLYTGDLATWDENGYITIVGRKDDMIISSGENIHPVQVEEILSEHPKVADAFVVGVPDATRGEVVCAYVVSSGGEVSARELDDHCRRHPMLAVFKKPRYYRFVSELPYTATGKKMRYKIREQAREDLKAGLLERV